MSTSDQRKVLITAALLYANGQLHFGHLAGCYLAADCYARFERLQGADVHFVSGSDEYGVAITLSAELAGHTPREHVEHYHKINHELFRKLNFSFDHYARTTWPRHEEIVNEVFNDLMENEYIEERETEHLYSEKEGRFLADRYVLGTCPRCHYEKARGDECPRCAASFEASDLLHPRSRMTDSPLTKKKTTHWYIRLDKLRPKLTKWLETRQWKPNVLNFLRHYLKELRPRAITRDASWGIPFPLAKEKVFYVWFEANLGYISASKEWAELTGGDWKGYWSDPKTRLVQFIGKDNIFFHGIFLPAQMLGQNQPYILVDALPANEFLNLEGRQFSKSDNWTIDLDDFLTRYSADQIRYTLAANAPETSDSEFTWRDFEMRCNSELVGKLGNLVNRTLVFAKRQCKGVVPPAHDPSPELASSIKSLSEQARQSYETFSLRRACHTIMELAAYGNVYFDKEKPWVLAKEEATRSHMESVIHHCMEVIKALAVIAAPIIPESAEKIWSMLGFTTPLHKHLWNEALALPLPVGSPLPLPEVLFQKIPHEQIEEEISKLGKDIEK